MLSKSSIERSYKSSDNSLIAVAWYAICLGGERGEEKETSKVLFGNFKWDRGLLVFRISGLLAKACPPALRAKTVFETSSADRGVTMHAGCSFATLLQYDSFREV